MRDQWKCGSAHGKNSYFPAQSLVEHKNLNSQDSKGSKPAEFSQQFWGGLVPSAFYQEGAGEGAGILRSCVTAVWAVYHC